MGALEATFRGRPFDASSIAGVAADVPRLRQSLELRANFTKIDRLYKRDVAAARRWLERNAGGDGEPLWLERDQWGWFRVRRTTADVIPFPRR